MVRDYKFRGHSLEKTLGMWDNVCIGEDQFIKVFKPEADLLLDTSFSYEICCLAPSITPLAGKLPENSPYAERLYQLAGAFSLCAPVDEGLIPADSDAAGIFGRVNFPADRLQIGAGAAIMGEASCGEPAPGAQICGYRPPSGV